MGRLTYPLHCGRRPRTRPCLTAQRSRCTRVGQTRARVLEAARTLGYTPNAMASALRAGRTSVVVSACPTWPLGAPVAAFISALRHRARPARLHAAHAFGATRGGPDGLQKACDRVRPVGLIAPASPPAARGAARQRHARRHRAGTPPRRTSVDRARSAPHRRPRDRAPRRARACASVAIAPLEPEFHSLGKSRLDGAREAATAARRGATAFPRNDLAQGLEEDPPRSTPSMTNTPSARGDLPSGMAIIGGQRSPACAPLRNRGVTTIQLGTTRDLAPTSRGRCTPFRRGSRTGSAGPPSRSVIQGESL